MPISTNRRRGWDEAACSLFVPAIMSCSFAISTPVTEARGTAATTSRGAGGPKERRSQRLISQQQQLLLLADKTASPTLDIDLAPHLFKAIPAPHTHHAPRYAVPVGRASAWPAFSSGGIEGSAPYARERRRPCRCMCFRSRAPPSARAPLTLRLTPRDMHGHPPPQSLEPRLPSNQAPRPGSGPPSDRCASCNGPASQPPSATSCRVVLSPVRCESRPASAPHAPRPPRGGMGPLSPRGPSRPQLPSRW